MKKTPQRHAQLVFERRIFTGPAVLPDVRHEVTEALECAGVFPQTINDALLVLSELGTNAIHAGGYGEDVVVRVALLNGGDVLVEVEDAGDGFRLSQALRLPDADDEHGRGLSIVCLVADETIVRRHRRRTIVRALIRAQRSA